MSLAAQWPAYRRLVYDLMLGGAALGAMLGYAAFGRNGLTAVVAGAAIGGLIGQLVGPRRYHLALGPEGVTIGRLAGTVHIAWDDIGAVGVEDGWQGRRGVTTALAVGRLGDEWPIVVPALSFHASGFRIGGQRPEEQIAGHRLALLPTIAPWAESRGVPVIPSSLDDWWDRNRDRLAAR